MVDLGVPSRLIELATGTGEGYRGETAVVMPLLLAKPPVLTFLMIVGVGLRGAEASVAALFVVFSPFAKAVCDAARKRSNSARVTFPS